MAKVVALDLSLTGTGVVVDGSPRTITTKLKDEARLAFIEDELNGIAYNASLVVIEGLAYGTQTGKAMERGGLHFMVRTGLFRKQIPFAIAPPTTIKKYITGKGNAQKDEVMIATVTQLPDLGIKNNNEADATVMWAMAMDWLGEPVLDLPKVNRTALDKVEWPKTN